MAPMTQQSARTANPFVAVSRRVTQRICLSVCLSVDATVASAFYCLSAIAVSPNATGTNTGCAGRSQQ